MLNLAIKPAVRRVSKRPLRTLFDVSPLPSHRLLTYFGLRQKYSRFIMPMLLTKPESAVKYSFESGISYSTPQMQIDASFIGYMPCLSPKGRAKVSDIATFCSLTIRLVPQRNFQPVLFNQQLVAENSLGRAIGLDASFIENNDAWTKLGHKIQVVGCDDLAALERL